jgi:hypothetical protein
MGGRGVPAHAWATTVSSSNRNCNLEFDLYFGPKRAVHHM